ncbi:hypothetical protein [Clostridium perfringens]|uniref:hypothetical protein n=1 Tax=Clostridium perfringens TaxID=1502 RepID=UPI001FB1869A|nr:hypothetical protein [Clostridium perfringens]
MKKIKSWQYDEKDLSFVIKNLEKSSFKRGSHIPIEIRKFFECEDVIYGQKKAITLIYNAENFKAEIEREKITK